MVRYYVDEVTTPKWSITRIAKEVVIPDCVTLGKDPKGFYVNWKDELGYFQDILDAHRLLFLDYSDDGRAFLHYVNDQFGKKDYFGLLEDFKQNVDKYVTCLIAFRASKAVG